MALAAFCSCAACADDVYFPLANLTTGPVTNRKVLLTPLELFPGANQVAVYDRIMLTSGVSGTLTVSNMMSGLYRCEIQAPPQLTSFYFFVPTNGTGGPLVGANTIQRVTPQQVNRPQDYAYSAQSSDARYLSPTAAADYLAKTNSTGYSNTLYNANVVTQPIWLMAGFQNGWPYKLWLCYSVDGVNFDYLGPDPIFTARAGSQITRDARWLVTPTNIYIAVTGPTDSRNSWILSSTNFATWSSNRVVDMSMSAGIGHSWGPRWFVDATNGLHFITQQSTNGTVGFVPVESHLTDPNDFATWSSGTEIAGWRSVWSNTIDHAFVYANGAYWCFFKQEDAVGLTAGAYIGLASNSSPVFTNTWSLVRSNDWAGWGVGFEGISLVQLPNGNWRIYFEQYSGAAVWFSDCPTANFPLGPWSAKQRVRMPQSLSNPGFLIVTNVVEIVRILGASLQLKKSAAVFDLPHAPYHDTIFGANIFNSGTNNNVSTWQDVDSYDTNRTSIFFNLYTGTGNPEIDLYWLPKNGLAGGVRNSFGVFNVNGWNGGVVGTTVSASSTLTASSTLVATVGTKTLSQSAAPAPAQIGANNGWLWVSNAYLYYSYTSNGSTSNSAVKIAP